MRIFTTQHKANTSMNICLNLELTPLKSMTTHEILEY